MMNIPRNISSYFQCRKSVCFYRKGSNVKGQVTFFRAGNKLLGIGSYHVLCANELIKKIYSIDFRNAENSPLVLIRQASDGNEHEIGKIIYGKLNDREDFAIVEITDEAQFELNPLATLNNNEKPDFFTVKTNGTIQEIIVVEEHVSCEINVNNAVKILFKNLIKANKISDKGDSGALVWNKAGNLVGIIEGDNAIYSFIVSYLKKQ